MPEATNATSKPSVPSENMDTHATTKFPEWTPFFVNFSSSLFAGLFCTALFNPWDRALYLSVKNKRPFLSFANFTRPYQGVTQAIFQRAFFGSGYYLLQAEMNAHLYPYLLDQKGLSHLQAQFCIGTIVGCTNGMMTNPVSAIKYHTWGQNNRTFFSSIQEMATQGGLKSFSKGMAANVGRDITFGSTYEVLRHLMKDKLPQRPENSKMPFVLNGVAAGAGIIAAAPLNYARLMQYATPANEKPESIKKILKDLVVESRTHNESLFGKANFFQQRLRLGWGTARMAAGMAVGQEVFDVSRKTLGEQMKITR